MIQYGNYVKRPALISKQDMILYRLYIKGLNVPEKISRDAKFIESLTDAYGFHCFRVSVAFYKLFRGIIKRIPHTTTIKK